MIDASAVLAILLGEPEEIAFTRTIETTREDLAISVIGVWEVDARARSLKGQPGVDLADAFLRGYAIARIPVTLGQIAIARRAFADYGKGRHPARLNMGDCFAYALAKDRDDALLFKGGDFALTDVRAAPP